jgi:hypothetical protein
MLLPESYQAPDRGVVVPCPLRVIVNWYCVFQFHVMLEGAFMLKFVEHVDPLEGTLPLPVQPVHTY